MAGHRVAILLLLLLAALVARCTFHVARGSGDVQRETGNVQPASQNPSPMVDATRAHQRLEKRDLPGVRVTVGDLLPGPVEVFVPTGASGAGGARLLIHFHGAAWVPMHAVSSNDLPTVLAAVHLGAGSGVYEKPFRDDPTLFARLLGAVRDRVGMPLDEVTLSAFSAGYGSVRAILRDEDNVSRVHGVLLLDGLHTGYIPEGKVMAEGGQLEVEKLEPFVRFARRAIAGEKTMVITHSEIFPGTFASTTETTDYLLRELNLPRTPVLKWGPLGMQQLSEARSGQFIILGFAGNTAPDHIDHFHGMSEFLDFMMR